MKMHDFVKLTKTELLKFRGGGATKEIPAPIKPGVLKPTPNPDESEEPKHIE
ncbi:MAG: hypothetical protein JW894_10905 [Bacteroidales bacterium]|nr:hypothetical protein [Bacteroidales bacterium]